MKCIICNAETKYFFSKQYTEPPFDAFMQKIGPVDYHKCTHCGFVLSKTHSALNSNDWSQLNESFHHHLENPENERKINQPPYAEQAMMLSLLGKSNVINTDSMIDYAAGYGTLSRVLEKYHQLNLPIFDPYIKTDDSGRYIEKSKLGIYKTVINSAMFEHILKREDLDYVNSIVDADGCLIIHTVVCENIPKDPNWFYMRPPVHTAFHTNKSMNILMEQWGFQSSLYCPQSKCWVLLRDKAEVVEAKIGNINSELQNTWFIAKDGFVDYWKGF